MKIRISIVEVGYDLKYQEVEIEIKKDHTHSVFTNSKGEDCGKLYIEVRDITNE